MIKIIDYRAGNAPSVLNAVKHLGYDAHYARCAQDLDDAAQIILPGVGSAGATMDSLREMGMISALEDAVLGRGVDFLGICVGMQILFEHSAEDDADCLGWLKGRVVKFGDDSSAFESKDGKRKQNDTSETANKIRVPQMGWNKVEFVKKTAVNAQDDYFYFVNSYYAKPADITDLWASADYHGTFTAAVARNNIFATQFHVEKSGEAGLRLLDGFLRLGG